MSSAAGLVGRYINLDRSVDRRAAFEARLGDLGVLDRYPRFAAIDGAAAQPGCPLKPGEAGCFLSHYELLRQHVGDGRHVHVLEDDAVLGPQSVPLIDEIVAGAMDQYDILYTDVSINFNLLLFVGLLEQLRATGILDEARRQVFNGRAFPRNVAFVSLAGQTFTGTTSYVVSRGAVERLVGLMAVEAANGPTMPVDMFYLHLVNTGQIRASCTVPFLTSVAPPEQAPSTIGDPPKAMDVVSFLMRSPFYVDRDDALIRRLTDGLVRDAAVEDFLGPTTDLIRFLLSDRFALPR